MTSRPRSRPSTQWLVLAHEACQARGTREARVCEGSYRTRGYATTPTSAGGGAAARPRAAASREPARGAAEFADSHAVSADTSRHRSGVSVSGVSVGRVSWHSMAR
jgi:hypothetical protein